MEDTEQLLTSHGGINLRPKAIYGLRTDIVGNIHFSLQQEVIYPVEGALAFHDYVACKQRFLRLPEGTVPLHIQISPHRKWLAVLEQSKNGKTISLYDMQTLKKRRTVDVTLDPAMVVGQLGFTSDSKGVVVLTRSPEETLQMIILDKICSTFTGHPVPSSSRATVECFASHPTDTSVVAVAGNNILSFLLKSDRGFTVTSTIKTTFNILSMAFLSADLIMLGTNNNELVLIENNEIKLVQPASEAEEVDLLIDQATFNRENEARLETIEKVIDPRVVCMTAFPRGFAFAMFNKVYVFERFSKFKFERKTILTVPVTIYPEALYQITNMAVDSKQETVIVTTKHSQIYVGILIVPETLKARHLKFTPLGALLHIGEIVDVSLCSWKPIIMTASTDQTIRIWNYETGLIELVRKFQVDVHVVELHNSGLLAAIGFADQLRVTQIFMDELNIVKTYNLPHCKCVKYSNYGHLMAAAHDNAITITSVYNLEIIWTLKGHNGTVLSVIWSKTDKYLFSGGQEGAVYHWDIETGERIQEIVQKGIEYISLCCSSTEPISLFAATNTGLLREFHDADLAREINVLQNQQRTHLTYMCLSRSDLVMFIANDVGDLYNVKLPFMEATGNVCTNFRFFVTKINKLLISFDGTMLVSISEAGTLAIWALENIEGKVAAMDQDLMRSQEVLIPRNILNEKNEQIENLELRLRQQAEEFQYQMSQNEIFDGQQMAEVHKSYCSALEELKRMNHEIEDRHTEEMNQITFQINDLKDDHKKQMNNLATQYSERMLIEYQKFTKLRENMLELRESYEEKLKKSAGTLQDTVEGLESDYKKQLDERKELIRDLMKEMEDKKQEFIEYCRQVEVENDRNMTESQLRYEKQLTNERTDMQYWRGRSGVYQKKFESLTKEVDNLLEEVSTLKEEHNKSQRNINRLNRNIEDLQKDITDRDYAIGAKEKRIQELLHKNQELDKYKQVLNYKIAELKAQIEPREFQINDKRKHIMEMENELAGLNQSNLQLELQLKELKDKYISNINELKLERHRARAGRECIQNLCTEIYNVSNNIGNPEKLKVAVRDLFHRHANDDELKRFISFDANVRDEFYRQRQFTESVLKMYKHKYDNKSAQSKYDKLMQQNVTLLFEVEKLRLDNKQLRSQVKKEIVAEQIQKKRLSSDVARTDKIKLSLK